MVLGLALWGAVNGSKWLDQSLAGLTFDNHHFGNVFWKDSKSGFFLTRTLECDGALVTLELTRDHHELHSASNDRGASGIEFKPFVKAFGPLTTGKGIAIGSAPKALVERLGRPSRIEKSGSRGQFLDYLYEGQGKSKGKQCHFSETYTFKAGRLIQIVFFRDATADTSPDVASTSSSSLASISFRG